MLSTRKDFPTKVQGPRGSSTRRPSPCPTRPNARSAPRETIDRRARDAAPLPGSGFRGLSSGVRTGRRRPRGPDWRDDDRAGPDVRLPGDPADAPVSRPFDHLPEPRLERRHPRRDLAGRLRLARRRPQAPGRPRPDAQADGDRPRLRCERIVRWPGRAPEVPPRPRQAPEGDRADEGPARLPLADPPGRPRIAAARPDPPQRQPGPLSRRPQGRGREARGGVCGFVRGAARWGQGDPSPAADKQRHPLHALRVLARGSGDRSEPGPVARPLPRPVRRAGDGRSRDGIADLGLFPTARVAEGDPRRCSLQATRRGLARPLAPRRRPRRPRLRAGVPGRVSQARPLHPEGRR